MCGHQTGHTGHRAGPAGLVSEPHLWPCKATLFLQLVIDGTEHMCVSASFFFADFLLPSEQFWSGGIRPSGAAPSQPRLPSLLQERPGHDIGPGELGEKRAKGDHRLGREKFVEDKLWQAREEGEVEDDGSPVGCSESPRKGHELL